MSPHLEEPKPVLPADREQSRTADTVTEARQQALLSQEVLRAQEEERARLSRDLYDGLGQSLTALRLELDWVRSQDCVNCEARGHTFAQVDMLLEQAAEELRTICIGLRPPLLDDLGFKSSVRQLVAEFEDRTRVTVDLKTHFDDDSTLAPEIALVAYRVLQEALTNVRRHGNADSVKILLTRDAHALDLVVVDDGQGFDLSEAKVSLALGIAGMRERTKLVDGKFEIHSVPQHGTEVSLRVPLAKFRSRRGYDSRTSGG